MMQQKANTSSVQIEATPGEVQVLRLSINNRLMIPVVIHLKMDDWVDSKGMILEMEYSISPIYFYLPPHGDGKMTVTLKIPSKCIPGDTIQSKLRIPGLEEYRIPLVASIKQKTKRTKKIIETDVHLNIPGGQNGKKEGQNDTMSQTQGSLKLLTSMAAFELIPGKWIIAELIIQLCRRGMKHAAKPEGAEWLRKMSLTRFYKNGCMVFRGAQLPQWVVVASSITSGISSVLGTGHRLSILDTWEHWLLNLIDQDLESPGFKQEHIGGLHDDNDTFLSQMGMEPEKWFGYFILGLSQISPRFESISGQLLEKIKAHKPAPSKNKKTKDVIKEKGSLQK